jgi:hypothetical protein
MTIQVRSSFSCFIIMYAKNPEQDRSSQASKGLKIPYEKNVQVFYFFTTKSIPHFGHLPGLSDVTSGCIVQV